MSETSTIFVSLLDEGVDVWRPVAAKPHGHNVYLILEQPYDRDLERWQFEPGDHVTCAFVDAAEGRILAATGRVTR